MNTPAYKKAYLQNLKLEVTNNNKNFTANIGNSTVNQYIKNTGQQVLGVSTFQSTQPRPINPQTLPKQIQVKQTQPKQIHKIPITNIQAKGTKANIFK